MVFVILQECALHFGNGVLAVDVHIGMLENVFPDLVYKSDLFIIGDSFRKYNAVKRIIDNGIYVGSILCPFVECSGSFVGVDSAVGDINYNCFSERAVVVLDVLHNAGESCLTVG